MAAAILRGMTMTGTPTADFEMLMLMERAALAGANAIVDEAKKGLTVQWKADNSIVLNLDIAAQHAMLEVLSGSLPVVSEEDPASHDRILGGGDLFVVDPLDGTSSCRRALKNHGEFVPSETGYGPMVGLVRDGVLRGAAFVNVASRTLYSALHGRGAFMVPLAELQIGSAAGERTRLVAPPAPPIGESALLFYPGQRGELPLVNYLKENQIVDGIFRFGGFANDCTRAARGFEQSVVQFSLKPWDLPAALIAEEAGLTVWIDPLRSRTPISQWKLTSINPVFITVSEYVERFRSELARGPH